MPRKTITANVSLPPEIHAWVKSKIAAILEVEPAANPTFTSVVSEALRRAMNEEKQREILMEENGKNDGAPDNREATNWLALRASQAGQKNEKSLNSRRRA